MNADLSLIGPVLVIVAIGCYTQAVVGFAFGLIFLSLSSSLDLLPVATTAILISFLALFNTASALVGSFKNVMWKEIAVSLIAVIPMMAVGLFLLDYLAQNNLKVLRIILGTTILICAVSLLKQPKAEAQPSSLLTYGLAGLFGGLLGGMFSTTGPPLVYQFYRQPLPHPPIRDSLLAIFLISSLFRTSAVVIDGQVTIDMLLLGLLALPVVIISTRLGRKFPPKFSQKVLRRFVFALLAVSALTLMAR